MLRNSCETEEKCVLQLDISAKRIKDWHWLCGTTAIVHIWTEHCCRKRSFATPAADDCFDSLVRRLQQFLSIAIFLSCTYKYPAASPATTAYGVMSSAIKPLSCRFLLCRFPSILHSSTVIESCIILPVPPSVQVPNVQSTCTVTLCTVIFIQKNRIHFYIHHIHLKYYMNVLSLLCLCEVQLLFVFCILYVLWCSHQS